MLPSHRINSRLLRFCKDRYGTCCLSRAGLVANFPGYALDRQVLAGSGSEWRFGNRGATRWYLEIRVADQARQAREEINHENAAVTW